MWFHLVFSEQMNGVASASNIRIWGEGYIRKVANEIIGRIKTASTIMQDSASHGQLSKRVKLLCYFSESYYQIWCWAIRMYLTGIRISVTRKWVVKLIICQITFVMCGLIVLGTSFTLKLILWMQLIFCDFLVPFIAIGFNVTQLSCCTT